MTDINYTIPTDAEIRSVVQNAHVLRAEMLLGFFAGLGQSAKTTLQQLGFFRPNLVKVYLNA